MLVHYVICTYISPPTSAQVDEAVYPAGIDEVGSSSSVDGVPVDVEKAPVTHEKELGHGSGAESPL
jgi:NCS1 family nucleobase:cation symporter-1